MESVRKHRDSDDGGIDDDKNCREERSWVAVYDEVGSDRSKDGDGESHRGQRDTRERQRAGAENPGAH